LTCCSGLLGDRSVRRASPHRHPSSQNRSRRHCCRHNSNSSRRRSRHFFTPPTARLPRATPAASKSPAPLATVTLEPRTALIATHLKNAPRPHSNPPGLDENQKRVLRRHVTDYRGPPGRSSKIFSKAIQQNRAPACPDGPRGSPAASPVVEAIYRAARNSRPRVAPVLTHKFCESSACVFGKFVHLMATPSWRSLRSSNNDVDYLRFYSLSMDGSLFKKTGKSHP